MPGPLAGFRVLDLSAVVSGPLTAALLADQGAEVIKVERVGAGDIQRHVGSRRNGFSGFFHVLNRGKRSLAADLGSDAGRRIVHRLAERSDVVIQNFRPGVVDRLGIGYAALSAVNPRLVYLSISGFGQTGPRAGERAYDPIIQTYSGVAAVQGRIHPEHAEAPEQVNQLILDKMTAYTGCQAVTAALLARERSGEGQHVELSMLDTGIAFMWADAAADLILEGDGIEARPPIGASGTMTRFADGFGATMTLSDAEFAAMCRAYGADALAEDPQFKSLPDRQANRQALRAALGSEVASAAAAMTVAEAEARFTAEQVPFARARRLDELPDDAQVLHNEMFRRTRHPVAGPLIEARPAARFGGAPSEPGGPAPTVGEHTREILAEIGFGAEVDDWLEAGWISAAPTGLSPITGGAS